MVLGNCQGVVGAELAVSGAAIGAVVVLVLTGSFNGAGRCLVRGAEVLMPPLPDGTFVTVMGTPVLGRDTRGAGSKTPFRRAASPGSLPGTAPLTTFSLGAAPPSLPPGGALAPSGGALKCPPCKVAACLLLVVTRPPPPLKPLPRILMAWAKDSLEKGIKSVFKKTFDSILKCRLLLSGVSKRLDESACQGCDKV